MYHEGRRSLPAFAARAPKARSKKLVFQVKMPTIITVIPPARCLAPAKQAPERGSMHDLIPYATDWPMRRDARCDDPLLAKIDHGCD